MDEQPMLNIWSLAMVFILQCLGAFEHWRLMKSEGRVTGSFTGYLTGQYPGHSFSTVLALMGTAWMAAVSGAADYLNPELLFALFTNGEISINLATAITGAVVTSVGVGYAFDSRFNKADDKPEAQQ